MKKILFSVSLITLSILLFSCKKESINTDATAPNAGMYGRTGTGTGGDSTYIPNIVTATSWAGQTIDAGTITVTNDANYIYVTYNTTNGYTLTLTHLFVGPVSQIPTNHPGNPMPGQFPQSSVHDHATTFTYQVPVSNIGNHNTGAIAAHGIVQKLDANGNVIDEQSIWGNGPRINGSANGNWAMYTPFLVQY